MPKKLLFLLGLHMIASSLVFGVVSYYYAETAEGRYCGEGTIIIRERDDNGFLIVTPGNVTEPPPPRGDLIFLRPTLETIYPLRNYHFLTYLFLAVGLVLVYRSSYIKISVKITREED